MKIFLTYDDLYFPEKSRILGLCYIIKENAMTYHYEFIITNEQAQIKSDTSLYLEDVAEYFHSTHPYIQKFIGTDFYMEKEKCFTFKLPISILQVSKFFLDEDYLESIRKHVSLDDIKIPVAIIEDEYVIIDNHHLLYIAKENDLKLIDVYLANPKNNTLDFLYLAKEQNIKLITDMNCLKHTDYLKIKKDLEDLFLTYL